MRLLIACLGTLFITVAGCEALKGISILMSFSDHPLVVKASEETAFKQDILAMQQPKRITPVRNNSSQCFDYELEKGSKRQNFHIGFTDGDKVNASGFLTCAEVIKAGYLSSNDPARQIY